MQGYAALLGFGTTRIKNQMVDRIPRVKNIILLWILLFLRFSIIFINLFGRYGNGLYMAFSIESQR